LGQLSQKGLILTWKFYDDYATNPYTNYTTQFLIDKLHDASVSGTWICNCCISKTVQDTAIVTIQH